MPRTAEEKPPGAVELTIPLTAAILDDVVLFIPSTDVPSPLLVIENKVVAEFSVAAKGSVNEPPASEPGAHWLVRKYYLFHH